jgi:hypothetical protein
MDLIPREEVPREISSVEANSSTGPTGGVVGDHSQNTITERRKVYG